MIAHQIFNDKFSHDNKYSDLAASVLPMHIIFTNIVANNPGDAHFKPSSCFRPGNRMRLPGNDIFKAFIGFMQGYVCLPQASVFHLQTEYELRVPPGIALACVSRNLILLHFFVAYIKIRNDRIIDIFQLPRQHRRRLLHRRVVNDRDHSWVNDLT